jgi:hypothetical protein
MNATAIFEFHANSAPLRIERIEVGCKAFTRLRSAMFRLINLIAEDGDDVEYARELRAQLLRWLTSPVDFRELSSVAVDALGPGPKLELRWGRDIAEEAARVKELLTFLRTTESPLRIEVAQQMANLAGAGDSVAIYCHRTDREMFESLLKDSRGGRAILISSERDYRCTPPVDVLLKIGPMRSRGFARTPAALLNAPRFNHLLQVVWEGLHDEPGFGSDPIHGSSGSDAAHPVTSFHTAVHRIMDTAADGPEEAAHDELAMFAGTGLISEAETGPAVAIRLADDSIIPFARGSEQIVVERSRDDIVVVERRAADIEPLRTLLVIEKTSDLDVGSTRATEGSFSSVWKSELRRQLDHHPALLAQRVRRRGVSLASLAQCLRHWATGPTTVIPAPQRQSHFRALIEALFEAEPTLMLSRSFVQEAWSEVMRSRSAALRDGMAEADLVRAEKLRILDEMRPRILAKCDSSRAFSISIPQGESFSGSFFLCQVDSVEVGYRLPRDMFGSAIPEEELAAWRE